MVVFMTVTPNEVAIIMLLLDIKQTISFTRICLNLKAMSSFISFCSQKMYNKSIKTQFHMFHFLILVNNIKAF